MCKVLYINWEIFAVYPIWISLIMWCSLSWPFPLIKQATILKWCPCIHDLCFSLLPACVFFFPHLVLSSSLIWFHDRRKTPIKTDFGSLNRLPALCTVSLLAMGGFKFSWEIVGKSRTPWSVWQRIKLQQGSWKSTLLSQKHLLTQQCLWQADSPGLHSLIGLWWSDFVVSPRRVTFISDAP